MNLSQRSLGRSVLPGAICLAMWLVPALAADVPAPRPSLDQGFRLLYNLDFDQAHQVFLSWEREHPQDPVGPTAEAAGILFSEFHRLGVLEGQFFENDKKFLDRDKQVQTVASATALMRLWTTPRMSRAPVWLPMPKTAMPCLP
jgi:hypothetical protein